MDRNNLFCNISSFQFGKKLVYNIHMSFVHKIDSQKYNSEKLAELKKEENLTVEIESKKAAEQSVEKTVASNDSSLKVKPITSNHLKLQPIDAINDKRKPHKCSICDYSFD